MTAFHCPTRQCFLDRYEDIADHVAAQGYAVLDAWDTESSTLKEVSERFGSVQTHIRADANGLVGISTETVVNREWEKYRSEYSGLTSEEFLPHTDGSYLHGLVHRGEHYIQLLPPKMLVLQCWQSAVAGGASILIDVQRVYDDLAKENPEHLSILSAKGCVTYCRDDQIAIDRAVFEELDDGTVMLRFRYDAAAYVADWAIEAFHSLQQNYFANAKYQSRLTLKKGQIIAIDNSACCTAAIRSRTAMPGRNASCAGCGSPTTGCRCCATPPTSTASGAPSSALRTTTSCRRPSSTRRRRRTRSASRRRPASRRLRDGVCAPPLGVKCDD